ncbi:uncharacterized protein LOC121834073 [Ixodes scapularis]|uniref:uncharacterized protein LOC121834073 n=1 Tax=Ixodes scapularis TaxID=6945 RepID=UPI001C38D53F|nr:uncharacterized protein LOC121834073 [Ixodes scapularis]
MWECGGGWQGAFCKHQALVHHRYRGTFPNASLLLAHDCHQLGLLSLGDNCQPVALFQAFKEPPGQPSTSTAVKETAAPAEPSSAPAMEHQQLASLDDSPPINLQEHRQQGCRGTSSSKCAPVVRTDFASAPARRCAESPSVSRIKLGYMLRPHGSCMEQEEKEWRGVRGKSIGRRWPPGGEILICSSVRLVLELIRDACQSKCIEPIL